MTAAATPLDVIEGRARWCVVEGDAMAMIASLPPACLDAVVTDPPYSSGGMFRGDRMQAPKVKYVETGTQSGSAECPEFSGDNRDQRSFCLWCSLWMGEALKATVGGGAIVAFSDWRQLPTMTDAVQCGGWIWRGVVPWTKPSSRPQLGRFSASCEYAVWGTNGPRPIEGDALPGFFEAQAPRERDHVTQKPLDVMRGLVKIAPKGGLVLDPFAGSGTTGVAALVERRRVILCEVVPELASVCRARLLAAESGTDHRAPAQRGLFAGGCT